MRLDIYDGQDAKEIYPDIKNDEDINIKRFYNEKLGIYIERTNDNIRIYCRVLAYGNPSKLKGHYTRYSNRTDPFYVVYYDKYAQDSFANFKRNVEKNFNDLGFDLVFTEERDNLIFRNMAKLDSTYTGLNNPLSHKDFSDITQLINDRERLEFKAGKIDDIAVFSREILKSDINNITIAIFMGDILANEGIANIFLDKNPGIPFTLTDNTKKILDNRERELDKKRKNNTIQEVKNKIKHWLNDTIKESTVVDQSIDNLKSAGCDTSEIEEIGKDSDITQLSNKLRSKLTSIGIDRMGEQKTGTDTTMVIVAALAALIVGMAAGIYIQPYLQGDFIKGSAVDKEGSIPTVTEIPTPTVAETPIPTVTETPTPTVTETPTPTDTVVSTLSNNTTTKNMTSPTPTVTSITTPNATTNKTVVPSPNIIATPTQTNSSGQ